MSTTSQCLFLAIARYIQSLPSHPASLRFILILSFHLCLSAKQSLSCRFPHQNPVCLSLPFHVCHMHCPSHAVPFDHPMNILVWSMQHQAPNCVVLPILLLLLMSQHLPSLAPSTFFPKWDTKFHTHTHTHKTTSKIKVLYVFILSNYTDINILLQTIVQ